MITRTGLTTSLRNMSEPRIKSEKTKERGQMNKAERWQLEAVAQRLKNLTQQIDELEGEIDMDTLTETINEIEGLCEDILEGNI